LLRNIEQSADQRAMRGWEWRRLAERARGDQQMVLDRSTAPQAALAASPDGRWLASVAEDGQVKLWDFAARRETNSWSAHFSQLKLRPGAPQHGLVFTSDSQSLITCGVDKRIRFWEVPSGRMQYEISGLARPATRLRISRDAKLLATASDGGQLTLWSLTNSPPTRLHVLHSGLDVLFDMALSPEGLDLVVGGAERPTRPAL
jgi:glucose repression regulatory protein TUP1